MIYLVQVSEGSSLVVIGVRVTVEGSEILLSINELLGSADSIPHLAGIGVRLMLDSVEGHIVPVMDASFQAESLDVTNLYKFFSGNPNFSDMAAIAQKLNSPLISATIAGEIKSLVHKTADYFADRTKVVIDVPPIHAKNSNITKLIAEYNASLGPKFLHITSELNRTVYMETPGDRVFIKLPDYTKLMNTDIPVSSFLPELKQVAEPYPHPIYTTLYGDQFLNANPGERMSLIKKFKGLIGDSSSKDSVPEISFEILRGNPANNATDILPNEVSFFKALEEFIRYDITQRFPEQEVDEMYQKMFCSARMLAFLEELLTFAYRLNWNHLNKMPLRLDDLTDDEDDSDTTSTINADNKLFIADVDMQIDEAMPRLKGYITRVAQSGIGFHSYIDAIIKLLRWGDSKPTVLKINGYTESYFDIATFRLRNNLGTLASAMPLLINGCEMEIASPVFFEERLKEPEFLEIIGESGFNKLELPVGILCRRSYEGGLEQLVYMSFFDVFSAYKMNPGCNLIAGLSFSNGKFQFTGEDLERQERIKVRALMQMIQNLGESKEIIHYDSVTMKEMRIQFAFKGNSSSEVISRILMYSGELSKTIPVVSFDSEESFAKIRKEQPFPGESIIRANLGGVLLSLMILVEKAYPEQANYNVTDILNTYSNVMTENGYINERVIFNRKGNSAPAEPVKNMNSFAPTATGSSSPAEELNMDLDLTPSKDYLDTLKETLFVQNLDNRPITAIMSGNSIIGGYFILEVDGRKLYVMVDQTELPAGITPSNTQYLVLVPLLFGALMGIMAGLPEKSQVKFTGPQALMHYQKVFVAEYKKSTGK